MNTFEEIDKSKPTKGPWMIQDLGERSGYPNWHGYAIRAAETSVHLATVGNVDRYYEGKELANATLMAAAPDLLKALKAMVRLHYDEGNTSLKGLEAVQQAEAAIKKAKL